jgi:hypothetical protein
MTKTHLVDLALLVLLALRLLLTRKLFTFGRLIACCLLHGGHHSGRLVPTVVGSAAAHCTSSSHIESHAHTHLLSSACTISKQQRLRFGHKYAIRDFQISNLHLRSQQSDWGFELIEWVGSLARTEAIDKYWLRPTGVAAHCACCRDVQSARAPRAPSHRSAAPVCARIKSTRRALARANISKSTFDQLGSVKLLARLGRGCSIEPRK